MNNFITGFITGVVATSIGSITGTITAMINQQRRHKDELKEAYACMDELEKGMSAEWELLRENNRLLKIEIERLERE